MLSERQLRILEAIIVDFIDTAQPVGSRTISKKYPLGISSATIRNEMADLEELGYLEQPHTSAGRVPSELGYRLYVDSLTNLHTIGTEQKELIQSLLLKRIIEANDIADQSAKILADFTGLVAVVTIPQFNKCRLANFKMVKVTDTKVLLILVTDNGIVKNVQLGISNTDQYILDKISDTMLSFLMGETIKNIDVRLISKLKEKLSSFGDIVDYLIPILKDAFKNLDDNEIHVAGEQNILSILEFSESERAKQIFNFLKSSENLKALAQTMDTSKLSIKIGTEIGIKELEDCSVISSMYKVDGKNEGKILVIGPKRIDYGSVISIVNYISNTLSDLFSGIYL
ncbi:heat-inducible transcriptional repressor HrcA [Fusibacter ferrireducens]|uniref:Heat-inducible transcription repressor HrcA n=1 Tax=Fusibacter ferrireducens TaxID=2785058 RepID=A0ABR9ZWS6_9FIRM|nr:heat-inducible transcriptional repressor HrcA [Fusibacter ferrireducens]MBF4694907.1 heat-inducible transcription repressor HrcA [Fusibacter ferrireducens]